LIDWPGSGCFEPEADQFLATGGHDAGQGKVIGARV